MSSAFSCLCGGLTGMWTESRPGQPCISRGIPQDPASGCRILVEPIHYHHKHAEDTTVEQRQSFYCLPARVRGVRTTFTELRVMFREAIVALNTKYPDPTEAMGPLSSRHFTQWTSSRDNKAIQCLLTQEALSVMNAGP